MKAKKQVDFVNAFLCLLLFACSIAFSWGTLELFNMLLEISGFTFEGLVIFVGLFILAGIAIKLWLITFAFTVFYVIS